MKRERPHLVWVRLLTILAGVATLLAIMSTWADRQIFDSQEWGDTSLEVLQNPEIRQQVANYAVDQLYDRVDVEQEIKDGLTSVNKSFGEDVGPLVAGPLAGFSRQGADQLALKALESQKVQSIWRDANIAANKTLVDLIKDRSDIVTTGGGQVRLQLKPLIVEIASQVGLGAQARDKIPDSVGDLEIVDSEEIKQVQTVASLIHGTALVASLLAIALIGLAVFLSPGYRWLTLLWFAVTFIVVALLVLALRSVAGNVIVPELATPDVQPAAHAAWDIATDLLKSIATNVIWASVILLVIAWLVSPTKPSAKTQEFLSVPFHRFPGPTFGLLAVVAFVFLIMGAGDGREFLIRLLIVLLAALGAWYFRRQTMLAYPDADYAGLREFGSRTGDKAKKAWADRPKNITLPKIRSNNDQGEEQAPAKDQAASEAPTETLKPEADTAVLPATSEAPAPAPAPAEDRLDQLEKLGKLKESGVIDDEEFAAEKKRILGN